MGKNYLILLQKQEQIVKKLFSKKIPHNTAKAIGKSILEENLRNVKEIVIPTRKREEILNVLDKYYRMELYKISK